MSPPSPRKSRPRKTSSRKSSQRGGSEKSAPSKSQSEGERLQKVLAAAGHGSRRACEELILAGRVEVDGKKADVLGTRVNPNTQEIHVDGVLLPKQRHKYYLLNKPTGVLCTNRDPSGRTRVIDLVPGEQRLFTVGRLDMNSEGLILVTNDGDLANELAHPRYGVEKLYEVEVAGKPDPEQLRQLRTGIHLAEAFVKVDAVKVKRRRPKSTLLEITIREGRNRELRRILAKIGHKVLRLKRVAMGPFRLAKLPSGAYRELTAAEVESLRSQKPKRKAASPKKTSTKKTSKKNADAATKSSKRPNASAQKRTAKKTNKRAGKQTARKASRPAKKKKSRGRR